MKPGYYWARHRDDGKHTMPVSVVLDQGGSLRVEVFGYAYSCPVKQYEFFGPCKSPGIRVARVQAPLRTPIDYSTKLSWAVNVPAVKSPRVNNGDGDGKAWGWIVRAASYDDARNVFRATFGFKRVPWGTTFTRLPTDDS